MARVHGQNADFSFASVVLEGELNSVTFNWDVPAADITSFTDAYQTVVAGKPALTMDIAGAWDSATAAGDQTLFNNLGGTGALYDFEPAGAIGYIGSAVVTNYSIVAGVGDAVKYTATFQHNGGAAAIDGDAPSRA